SRLSHLPSPGLYVRCSYMVRSADGAVRFPENRNGFSFAIWPVTLMVSPNGECPYEPERVPVEALTKARTFPFPSKATRCAPMAELLTVSNPPTPPAPSKEPLTSRPHMYERRTSVLVAFNSAAACQPLFTRIRSSRHR